MREDFRIVNARAPADASARDQRLDSDDGSGAGHAFRPDGALLGGDAELRVGGAIAAITAAPLDDLEEEALAVVRAVELEIFAAVGVAVVEDVLLTQPVGEVRVEAEAGLDVVIIVARDLQRPEAGGAQRYRGDEDIVRRFSAPFSVRRSEPSAFSIAWLRTSPAGSGTSTIGVLWVAKIDV